MMSVLALVGCEKKPAAGSPGASGGSPGPTGPSTRVEERIPSHSAEIFMESTSPEKGTVRYSGSVASSYQSETRDGGGGITTKEWKSESSELKFELLDGSLCRITPTFLGDRDGKDEWRVELEYESTGEEADAPRDPVSKTVHFDGETAVTLVEDESHSVTFQPAGGHRGR